SIRRGRKKHPTVWPWFCQKRPWFSKAWPKSWAWTHCGRADKGNTRAAPSISFRSATYLCFFGIPSKLPLGDPKVEYTIVGVAGNSRYTQVRETEHPMAYVPFMQPPGVLEMQYELHTTGDPI